MGKKNGFERKIFWGWEMSETVPPPKVWDGHMQPLDLWMLLIPSLESDILHPQLFPVCAFVYKKAISLWKPNSLPPLTVIMICLVTFSSLHSSILPGSIPVAVVQTPFPSSFLYFSQSFLPWSKCLLPAQHLFFTVSLSLSTGNLAQTRARVTAASRSLPPQLSAGRIKVSRVHTTALVCMFEERSVTYCSETAKQLFNWCEATWFALTEIQGFVFM